MARIALSIAGGIIGAFFGPAGFSIGFAIGGMLGAALFPPKLPTNYGPRLNDKQVTSSAAGEPIPFGYGGFRIGGNIIWSDVIKEITHKQTQSAKGGPTQTSVSYTYTCSFAVAFCEGPGSILRIWADSKIIYDTTSKSGVSLDTGVTTNNGANHQTVKFLPTLYTGTQTQGPDPTIQAKLGVGLTPGYRGLVYAVFTDFPLADFGNRIPSFRAEISTGNVTAFVKDAYRSISTLEDQNTSPALHPATHCKVDAKNRIGYFFGSNGQSVMAIDLNEDTGVALLRWQANTHYGIGAQILDSNGNVQYVQSFSGTGTSAASEPTWATVDGVTTTDHPGGNQIVWLKVGVGPNAVVVLREGILDPTPLGPLFAPDQFGSANPNAFCVDTLGHIWSPAIYNYKSAQVTFLVRYDPITFKATTRFNLNVHETVPPGVMSVLPVRVGGFQDLIYLTITSTTGAAPSVAIINSGGGLLHDGMVWLDTLWNNNFGTAFCDSNGTFTVDPATGIMYFLLNNAAASGPGPFPDTWLIQAIDPRDGTQVVPVPTWGKNAGQWNNSKTIFSRAIAQPPGSTDGFPQFLLWDASDNTLLCFSGSSSSGFPNVVKIDATLGTVIADAAVAYTTDSNFQTYFLSGYEGQVPSDGLVKLLSTDNKSIIYLRASDLVVTQTIALNNWEPALGSGSDFFFGFGFDPGTDSALVTPNTYRPIPLRFFFDRQAVQSETLDLIVSDLLQRGGVPAASIDVTALAGINCLGYCVTRTSNAKAALQALCMAYFFDIVESDFKLKAVVRGQSPSQNIPETDLGISDEQSKLTETIAQEQDLPKTVSVEYIDPAMNYQTGKQHKFRHSRVKKTKNHDILQLPIALHGDDAAQIADKYLAMLWAERNMYDWKLWNSKYLVIDPTDVVQFTYQGLPFQARIIKETLGQNRILELSGVSEDAREYLSVLAGAGTQDFQNGTITPSGLTILFLLDTPLLRDLDDNGINSGFYYLLSSPTQSRWPGGNLFQSSDNQNFATLDSDFNLATYGIATAATPDVAFPNGVLHPFSWDFVTTVNVKLAQGTLSSTSELNVLNGANAFILGNEVMQFQNAVLNGDGSYTLSKLLRGRRGTEPNCHFHQVGETFLLLDSATRRIQQSSSIIGLLRYYRSVTIGQEVTNGTTITDTLQGNDLKPYAPAQFTAGLDASNNLASSWVRRTRIGGAWFDGNGTVPLAEQTEQYDVEIMAFNNGGVRKPSYTVSPANAGQIFYNLSDSSYYWRVLPFTITWEDGVTASYAYGQAGEGLGPTKITAGGPVSTFGTSIWVNDPTRSGTNSLSAFGFDNGAGATPGIPDDMHANQDGHYNLLFVPGSNKFPVGTSSDTIYLSAVSGDAVVRSFTNLGTNSLNYTDAQMTTDFSRNEFTAVGAPGFVRARVYQKSAVVGRGFKAENPALGQGVSTVSGGSDATSILGVNIRNVTLVDGSILQYNASNNTWDIVGPMLKRTTITKTTGSLLNGTTENGTLVVNCRSFVLLSIESSGISRVQLYETSAFRTADNTRSEGSIIAPGGENGIICDESLVAGGDETRVMSSPLLASNMDSPVAQQVYYAITNNTGGTAAITVKFVIIPIEY